jgi:hypothetical protein
MKAFSKQDKEKVEALAEDMECKAAHQAYAEYQSKMAELERKKREEERRQKKEREEAQYAKEYEEFKESLGKLGTKQFFAVQSDCSGLSFGKPTAKCKAFNELKDEKSKIEIDALIKKYKGDDLTVFMNKSCKGIGYSDIYCRLSREAVAKQEKDKVNYYLENRSVLKQHFNECQKRQHELWNKRQYSEANEYLRTFQCRLVGRAAQKLNVFDFRKPIE